MEAGWYSDPNGGPDLRWWDGSAWTEHTSAPAAGAGSTSAAASPTGAAGAPGDASADAPPSSTPPGDIPAGDIPSGDIPPAPDTGSGAFPPPAPGASGGFAPPDPASGGFPPPGPASGGYPPAGPPPHNDSSRYLLIGLVALIVVLLGVGGVVLLSGDGDDETTTGSTTTTEDDETTTTTEGDETTTTEGDETTTTAGEPDSEFVSSGGMTFTRLSDPWMDWVSNGQGSIAELEGTAGQFVVVQEQAPSGGQWISNLLIGDLTSTIPYSGEADLQTATHALADALIGSYYVEGAQSSIVLEQPVTIDGHPAYFIHHELTFQQEGLETTREKVIVVVVDTGRARPGVFWASIPYNRSDLNAGMDEAYASLTVND